MGLVSEKDKWQLSDSLWNEIKPLLPPRKPHPLGCHNPHACRIKTPWRLFYSYCVRAANGTHLMPLVSVPVHPLIAVFENGLLLVFLKSFGTRSL